MSPRAAWRLEALGFSAVYDYVTGKADWLAAGLPTEGEGPRRPRVGDMMDPTVPTCTPDQRVRDVAQRLGSEWDTCVVINDNRICRAGFAGTAWTRTTTVPSKRSWSRGPRPFEPMPT